MTGQAAKTKKVFDRRYEILSIVGRGACSVVYHARHISSPNSEVALKVLVDQKGKNPSAERLRREALAMVSCRHRYVARLDDFHSIGSLCYLSMEYAAESDLRNFVEKGNGKLTVEQAQRFLKQCAEGIAFIHRAGIIHRDIKPENILVFNEKEIRITDFGVALLPGEECSIADLQSGVGTMNYMAPEIIEGKPADQRSDLYALGVVFYELVSGQNPFAGAPLARQIDVRKNESFASLNELDPSIPEYLSDLIKQCMRYDPDDRFTSGDELLANLMNQKAENFAKENKSLKVKPTRPKTNDFHKRSKKPLAKKAKEENADESDQDDLFKEFDRLVAEESAAIFGKSGTSETMPSGLAAETSDSARISSGHAVTETQQVDISEQEVAVEFDADDPFAEPALTLNKNESKGEVSRNEKSDTDLEGSKHLEELTDRISAGADSSNELEEDFEEDLEFENQRTYKPKSLSYIPESRGPKFLLAAVFVLLLGILLPGLRHSLANAISSSFNTVAFWKKATIELPIFEAKALTFPLLPKGVYSGSLEGVIPGKTVPLNIISFEDGGKIAILLGIEGWTPVILDQKDLAARSSDKNSRTLRVASNGIILALTGEIKNGGIVGYFTNLINGAQGQWSAEPAVEPVV